MPDVVGFLQKVQAELEWKRVVCSPVKNCFCSQGERLTKAREGEAVALQGVSVLK